MPERWIVVEHWNRYQHYGDRSPAWIKNHLDLLHNDGYLELTPNQRAVLHGLWLLYASAHGEVRENTARLSRQLNLRVMRRTLEALNHAGFIRFSASKPLALTRSGETETEKTKKTQSKAVASYVPEQWIEKLTQGEQP